MKKETAIQLLLLIFIGMSPGCKSRAKSSESDIKYGFLDTRQKYLIHLSDDRSIRLCGSNQKIFEWAIDTWGKALGRNYKFVSDCVNPDLNLWGHVYEHTKARCKKTVGDATNRRAIFVADRGWPLEIYECGGFNDFEFKTNMLHEVGHAFGLCDMYEAGLSNCSVRYASIPGSVMHSAKTLNLQPDDIAGVRRLARVNRLKLPGIFVTMEGAGEINKTIDPPVSAKTFLVSFTKGCNEPWVSQLILNDGEVVATARNPEDNSGPWIFEVPSPVRVTRVGARTTKGGCQYYIESLENLKDSE